MSWTVLSLWCLGGVLAAPPTADFCETTWPGLAAPTPEQSRGCVRHWLRHAYGPDHVADDLQLDPRPGGAVSTRFTAAQFLRMQAHVRAVARTPCDDVEQEPEVCRTIAYLGLEADSHLSLIDPWALVPIEPVLRKVLSGARLGAADLRPGNVDGARYAPVTLWRLRNAVYARHGRAFQNPDLQRFFYEPWASAQTGGLLPLKVDPAYVDSRLTAVDRANVALIQKHEAAR